MELQQRFSDHVLAILEREGLTQADLARRLNKRPGYVCDYLKFRRSPGLDVIEQFAKALGVDAGELLAPDEAFARSA